MFRQRRIIVNDDGLARVGDEDGIMEQRLMRAVNTQVDSYFLCVGQTSTGSAPGAEGCSDWIIRRPGGSPTRNLLV